MFDKIERANLEQLHFKFDPASQLRAIIAIHSTRVGPALGGCRCIAYPSDEAAIDDAIRLARGMSYKAALANVPQGGGKSVIILPEPLHDRTALYRAFGQFVDELGGRYITAVDSGSTLEDMAVVAQVTPYVSGSLKDGLDPSPVTAAGVFAGMQAAVKARLNRDTMSGLRVAIQGLGHVGYTLAAMLHKAQARLVVSDINPAAVQRCVQDFGAEAVAAEAIYDVDCEVFAPCGLGGVLNPGTLPRLRCSVIAGSANNQLSDAQQGLALHEQGILYAPDYVINAGGLITASLTYHKVPAKEIQQRTEALGETLARLFERSRIDDRPPPEIADEMAEEILYP